MSERDEGATFIAYSDLLICLLIFVLIAVTTTTAKVDGIKDQSWFLVSIDWPTSVDADADLWLIPPSQKPVYYSARDVGCVKLDTDSRGFLDGNVKLPDGSYTKVRSYKETAQFRCIEPGNYQLGANLFGYKEDGMRVEGRNDLGLRVHAEIVGLNPAVHTVYSGDVVLNHVGETVNIIAFDIDRNGSISLSPPQLEEVTAAYQRHASSSAYTPGSAP